MNCSSCGSEYDERLAQCPYCGSENEVFARKEQRDYIAFYEKKIDELDMIPKQMVKRAGNKVMKIAAVLVVVFLVMAGNVWLTTRQKAARALEKQQEQLARLEEYCQAGNYGAMGEYLDEINGYGSSYRKYEQIEQIYNHYENIRESAELHKNQVKQYYTHTIKEDLAAEYFIWDLKDCFRQLKKIYEIEKEDFPYGNEEEIYGIKDKYIEILKTELLLTPEEIDEGTVRYEDSDTDYTDLAIVVAQRLVEELYES